MKKTQKGRSPKNLPVKNDKGRYVPFFLLALLLLLGFPETCRLFRVYTSGDGAPKFACHFSIDGVPVKWGYAGSVYGGKVPHTFLGLSYLKQVNETFQAPLLDHNINGAPLVINTTRFDSGLGTHAPSKIALDLGGRYARFSCKIGLDQTSGPTNGVVYSVIADGKEIFRTARLKSDANLYPIDCSVAGVHELILVTQNENEDNQDVVDWVDLKFTPALTEKNKD